MEEYMTARQRLGQNILDQLKEIDRDYRWLAQETGKSHDAVMRYITGYRVPTAIALRKMAVAMGCTMDSLMEGVLDDDR